MWHEGIKHKEVPSAHCIFRAKAVVMCSEEQHGLPCPDHHKFIIHLIQNQLLVVEHSETFTIARFFCDLSTYTHTH